MGKNKLVVADISLKTDSPTTLAFADLYTWVIWQFPKPVAGGLCGAVRPPGSDYNWFPAVVETNREKVRVFAHLEQTYTTPETAAEYLCRNGA